MKARAKIYIENKSCQINKINVVSITIISTRTENRKMYKRREGHFISKISMATYITKSLDVSCFLKTFVS